MSSPDPTQKGAAEQPSRVGRFIQTYSSFLSSFVIGVAGLVATSIWQYRQSQTAMRQAESEQKIATTKAENEWRIARAEILAKNLNVLSTQGPSTADQRFGVLLSLTRGAILDPELAVSYALELGKDNVGYMRDVLAATPNKNYQQLAQAFALTCLQRYGVRRDADICKSDRLGDRSDAIAELVRDELGELVAKGENGTATGPLSLLRDQRAVVESVAKLAWLFEPYLQDRYEKRQWHELAAFESSSAGAKLVAAIVLATARTGELTGEAERDSIERFHAERRKWLADFLLGRSCDPECRGKLLDVMLSVYGESDGDYDQAIRQLLLRPRGETAAAIGRLHARLLWCQVDKNDLALFRDDVLVPSLAQALASPKEPLLVDDLVRALAMTEDPPSDGSAPQAWQAWQNVLAVTAKAGERVERSFAKHRAAIRRERADPPPMIKRGSFCGAAEVADAPE